MNYDLRNMYRSIRQQKKNYQIRMRGMKDKEGKTKYQSEDIKTIWVEHFYGLIMEKR